MSPSVRNPHGLTFRLDDAQCTQLPASQPQPVVGLNVAASDGLARRAVLMGTLAPEVGNMTALRVLNLAGNNFTVRCGHSRAYCYSRRESRLLLPACP